MTDQTDDDGPASVPGQQQGPVAVLSKVHKTYHLDTVEVPVIRGVDILVRHAKFTVLIGPSGSGKTTLLNMLGCIESFWRSLAIVAMHALPLADFLIVGQGFAKVR